MQVQNFIELFSKERAATYIKLGIPESQVVELYTINLKVAATFYIPLHGLELTLRNKIHNQLSDAFGEDWILSDNILLPDQQALVRKTTNRLKADGKDPIAPRIVASLTFSFWEHLFSPMYEELWLKHLHKIVEQPPKKFSRKELHKRLVPLRKLRNRIAHYECIINYPIQRYYEEIIECIKWLYPEVSEWTRNISNTKELLDQHKSALLNIQRS